MALALALGGAGGVGFQALSLPLPWMLGSLSVCTIAVLCGLRPAIFPPLRNGMISVLGVLLGSAFTPQLVERVPLWSHSLLAMAVLVAAATMGVMVYLRKIGAYDPVTAYFAAAPGGINEMVLAGAGMGGDETAITLIHVLRILLIVFAVPIGFRWIAGTHSVDMGQAMGTLANLAGGDALALAACIVVGALAGAALRFPAARLTGPMAASAIAHLTSLSAAQPPAELVMAAQVVVGSALGCRFVGMRWRDLAATARLALGSTIITLSVSIGGALVLAALTSQPASLLLLAFVPGGIAEMCLIALAMGQDVAFVSTHHVLRVVLVICAAPLVFRLMRRMGRAVDADGRFL